MKGVNLKFKIGTRALLTVFVILSAILTLSGYWEFQSRRVSVLNLMAQMSRNLSITIQRAALNSIHSYDVILDETTDRLFSIAYLIADMEREGVVTDEYLSRYADEQELKRINIYDRDGAKLYSSYPAHKFINASPQLYKVLSGQIADTVIDIHRAKNEFGERYVVSIHRSGGGAVVVNIDAAQLLGFRRKIGVGNIINSIAHDSSIVYIGIQDSIGILSASEMIDSLSSFQSDTFLLQNSKSKKFQWRITKFQGNRIFEGILPFGVGNISYGVIRIGLDYLPIQAIQQAAIRQGIMRFGLLLIVGLILFGLSISIQNVNLLEREKERITGEVYNLQKYLRQKEKLSAMGELAAGVAHEIQNPLNAISMTVQRLGKEFTPASEIEEQAELIRTVRKEINRISDIIRQFLEFARPAPLQKKWFYLDELIQKVVHLYDAKVSTLNIKIHYDAANKLNVFLDSDRLQQALINMLENATDAIEKNGDIYITWKKQHKIVNLSIKDTGVGIPKEQIVKIFNLYYTTKARGTGFGLAQVYQSINEHGGSIDVSSEPGAGTEFSIKLPIKRE